MEEIEAVRRLLGGAPTGAELKVAAEQMGVPPSQRQTGPAARRALQKVLANWDEHEAIARMAGGKKA